MKRTGITNLPLHKGRAPPWLFKRMVRLARGISTIIIEEQGPEEFLKRLSNPYWFQALSCTLGFDWHSSGTTTTTCGALKEALRNENTGIHIAGGKGKTAMKTPTEIKNTNLSERKTKELIHASKTTAKVDNALIQDNYQLYHHTIFFTEQGTWTVIQQGMNNNNHYARRYHWHSKHMKTYVVEPHTAICTEKKNHKTLNMTAQEHEETRKASLDLINDTTLIRSTTQRQLNDYLKEEQETTITLPARHTIKNMNKRQQETLRRAADIQPQTYEELITIKGVGPALIRSLALTANIIYGTPLSWKDPVTYSFAHGGKDGIPYPVDKKTMDTTTEILRNAVQEAKIGIKDKLQALKRLATYA